jgi:hypothetical protein
MDLVSTLAQNLGIQPAQAQAMAGLVLGTAKAQAGPEEAQKLEAAVPELSGWVADAKTAAAGDTFGEPVDEPGMMDDLARFASSGLGGSLIGAVAGQQAAEQAQLVALLSKVGLNPSHAMLAAPVVLSFLKDRLGDTWFGRLMAAAPILTGVQQAADSANSSGAGASALGGVASAFGSLFGGK